MLIVHNFPPDKQELVPERTNAEPLVVRLDSSLAAFPIEKSGINKYSSVNKGNAALRIERLVMLIADLHNTTSLHRFDG